VKGKVLQSMSHGLPVVATSPAVEGIPAVDGQDILISDDSDSFAFKMAQVYHDKNLWEQLSQNGMCVVSEHFSAQAARRGLDAMLKALNFSPRNTARIEQ
jgi:glycosyltransferase involved in cell wall biosynthesis